MKESPLSCDSGDLSVKGGVSFLKTTSPHSLSALE